MIAEHSSLLVPSPHLTGTVVKCAHFAEKTLCCSFIGSGINNPAIIVAGLVWLTSRRHISCPRKIRKPAALLHSVDRKGETRLPFDFDFFEKNGWACCLAVRKRPYMGRDKPTC